MSNAGFQRQRQCLRIHMGNHQQHAVLGIGDDDGDETAGIEARRKDRTFLQCLLVGGSFRKFQCRHRPGLLLRSRLLRVHFQTRRRRAPW